MSVLLTEQLGRMKQLFFLKESDEKINDTTTGSAYGQTDMSAQLEVQGRVVAKVDYSIFQGEVHINFIQSYVPRKGYARRLMEHLIKEYGLENIHLGMLLDDGAALIRDMRKVYPTLGVHEPKNNHIPVESLSEIQNPKIRQFLLELHKEGYSVFERYRGVRDLGGYDLNDLADLSCWVQGSKTNNNRPEDEVPYPVMEVWNQLTEG